MIVRKIRSLKFSTMKQLIVFLLTFSIKLCLGNLPTLLNFTDIDKTQNGISFPDEINVVKGHDIMINLLQASHDHENCFLRSPNFTMLDISGKYESARFESWGDKCGIKIKNVQESDEGIWRLTSKGKTENIEGVFFLTVVEPTLNINENAEIELDTENTTIEFGDKSAYCYLSQDKESETSFVYGTCSLFIRKATKNLQGNWKVKMGVYGNIDEEQSQTSVKVTTEDIDVGYIDNIKEKIVHMYCNLKYSENPLDFCRFERVSDGKAFNLFDGIGKDRYSYYGQGLRKYQCGITIKQPINQDYGNWKCSVGIATEDETKVFNRVLMLHKSGIVQIHM